MLTTLCAFAWLIILAAILLLIGSATVKGVAWLRSNT